MRERLKSGKKNFENIKEQYLEGEKSEADVVIKKDIQSDSSAVGGKASKS